MIKPKKSLFEKKSRKNPPSRCKQEAMSTTQEKEITELTFLHAILLNFHLGATC